ncbi:hypothetical protein C8Q74DRAFT_311159 [Fomes fomentarius]|nr:hypothetical protein C8Q74DRAFT_311159 [Fomes fomentarius]
MHYVQGGTHRSHAAAILYIDYVHKTHGDRLSGSASCVSPCEPVAAPHLKLVRSDTTVRRRAGAKSLGPGTRVSSLDSAPFKRKRRPVKVSIRLADLAPPRSLSVNCGAIHRFHTIRPAEQCSARTGRVSVFNASAFCHGLATGQGLAPSSPGDAERPQGSSRDLENASTLIASAGGGPGFELARPRCPYTIRIQWPAVLASGFVKLELEPACHPNPPRGMAGIWMVYRSRLYLVHRPADGVSYLRTFTSESGTLRDPINCVNSLCQRGESAMYQANM